MPSQFPIPSEANSQVNRFQLTILEITGVSEFRNDGQPKCTILSLTESSESTQISSHTAAISFELLSALLLQLHRL